MNRKATLVCDLQFGSTGKGLIAGYLAERDEPDVVVTGWSANAGHTYIDKEGRKFIHSMLANGIVSPKCRTVLIGPGSQINLDVLRREINECQDIIAAKGISIFVHPHAAIIQERHVQEEAGPMTKIGSTKKGCGAAMIEKIRRHPENRIVAKDVLPEAGLGDMLISPEDYRAVLEQAERVLVEGAQGYSLGINSGFYPYCTSRECTPAQILIDCGVPVGMLERVVGTARTYPIRVANRYDENGQMVGFSGPCYSDQRELSWEELGLSPEFTTVTKLKRRVFTFSPEQMKDALWSCDMGVPFDIFLNFVNYLTGTKRDLMLDMVRAIANQHGAGLRYIGMGPTFYDVVEV